MVRSAITRTPPAGPRLGHKISKIPSSGGSWAVLLVPGAPSDVHQGNALVRVPARGIAKAARRIVPDGFSCSTCAHLGRFAWSFLQVLSDVMRAVPPRRRRAHPESTILAAFLGASWGLGERQGRVPGYKGFATKGRVPTVSPLVSPAGEVCEEK